MRKIFLTFWIVICGSGLVHAQVEQLPVPPVAPDFRAPQKPMPELNRVGVDMSRQRPLGLREALSMALANNKDIEVARENVRIACGVQLLLGLEVVDDERGADAGVRGDPAY